VKTDELTATSEYVPLLTWKYTNDKMAWGVLLLMGGGFALADGCAVSLTFELKFETSNCFHHSLLKYLPKHTCYMLVIYMPLTLAY